MTEGEVTFIRIPKNASTSLYSFFGDKNTIRNECFDADNPRYLNIFETSHRSIMDAEENISSEILDIPVIAVVRNPYDRLVSMYFFARKHDLGLIYGINTDNFDDFARDFYKLSSDSDFFHAMTQCEYIKHEKCDEFTIIRFEELENGICKFIDDNDLGRFFDKNKLEKLNRTEHKNYNNYYSDSSREAVESMWGCDLDRFSYSFDI